MFVFVCVCVCVNSMGLVACEAASKNNIIIYNVGRLSATPYRIACGMRLVEAAVSFAVYGAATYRIAIKQ